VPTQSPHCHIMSAIGWCEAIDMETQKCCECRQYREAENPVPDRPIRCLECLHGRSLHTRASELPKKEERYDVRSILSSLVGSGAHTKGITTTLEAAQKETNEGLKKASESSASGSKRKEKSKVSPLMTIWISFMLKWPVGLDMGSQKRSWRSLKRHSKFLVSLRC